MLIMYCYISVAFYILRHYECNFFFSDMVIFMDSITVTDIYMVTVTQGGLIVIHIMQTWRVSL